MRRVSRNVEPQKMEVIETLIIALLMKGSKRANFDEKTQLQSPAKFSMSPIFARLIYPKLQQRAQWQRF